MSDFVEFNFPDGQAVLVEVWPTGETRVGIDAEYQLPGSAGVEAVGLGARIVEQAGRTLNEAFAPLVPVLSGLHDQVTSLPRKPEELTVEFGVKLTAGLKLAVVSGGEANFNVSATWRLSDDRNTTSVAE
ncbi:CU044_2847 family protein [Streptomyces sp. NPDC017520]|uniref:CU044_2847 family protein n=1 Tax=Streptomyces sp. NPDC017520 TaxID=3364998 RepID=UPI00379564E5